MFLVSQHTGCCAGELRWIDINVNARWILACQKCLLLAGASRVEAKKVYSSIAVNSKVHEVVQHRVLGSAFFITNVMSCMLEDVCGMQHHDLPGTEGRTRGVATFVLDHISSDQHIKSEPMDLDDAPTQHLSGHPSKIASQDQTIPHFSEEGRSRICLHKPHAHSVGDFEACIHKHSDAGDMEKYYLHSDGKMSIIYVLYTSSPESIKPSCDKTRMKTIKLAESLCDLFKHKISHSIIESKARPNIETEVPLIETTEVESWRGENSDIENEKLLFQNLRYTPVCLVTQILYATHQKCWKCLTATDGLIVLDQDESFALSSIFHRARYNYRIIFFSAKEVPSCTGCGVYEYSDKCMVDSVHTLSPVPVISNTEGSDQIESEKRTSDKSSRCVKANFLSQKWAECNRCFNGHGALHRLSLVELVVVLFQNPNKEMLSALRQCVTTKTTKTPTACIEIRFMPDFL